MNPFTRDSKLSISALQELNRVAQGTRRHIAASGNFYTGPGGAIHSDVEAPSSYQTAQSPSVGLNDVMTNINDLVLKLPVNTTWLLQAQLTASITSSATGAGDYLGARYYDGTVVYGIAAAFAATVCDYQTVADTAPLTAVIAVGNIPILVNVQMEVVTSTGSTGLLIDGYPTALQIS